VHYTDAGVGSSQINTNDSSIVVLIFQTSLFFCSDSSKKGEREDKDEDEVEDGGPFEP